MHIFDAAVAAEKVAKTEATKHERSLTCTKTCAGCCYQKILVSAFEGVVAYLYLVKEGLWNDALREKIREADRNLTATTHFHWLAEIKKPCVFLSEESLGRGLCTIHPARPISCASTFSDLGDPSLCMRVDTDGQMQVMGVFEPVAHLFHLAESVENTLNIRHEYMTLPGAVLYAEALLNELPVPEIHRVSPEDHPEILDEPDKGVTMSSVFDRIATLRSERPAS